MSSEEARSIADGSSDLDTESDASPASSEMASPRPSTTIEAPLSGQGNLHNNAPNQPPTVPKLGLKIPPLNLSGAGPSNTPAAPTPAIKKLSLPPPPIAQQQQQKQPPSLPPRPSLDLSRLGRQPPTSSITEPSSHPPPPLSARSLSTPTPFPVVEVELLSPAFQIMQSSGTRSVDSMQRQCAAKLGIRQDRVQLYALVPISSIGDIPSTNASGRIAVQVQGSGFSLQAIEEVLVENKKLAAMARSGPSLVSASVSELDLLRKEVAHLRQRLTSSEMLRHRGQQALQELKEEFETLHFDLLQHSDDVMTARTPRPPLLHPPTQK